MERDDYQIVERVLDKYLEMNNHRKTPERYTILKAIYNTGGHFTLEGLGDILQNEYNFPVSRATLYNTLNLFMELRLVVRHRFMGTTMYEAYLGNSGHCHQVCTVCGKVTEFQSPLISEAIESVHLRRFRKDGFALYVYGICSTCQTKITKRKNSERKKTKTDKK